MDHLDSLSVKQISLSPDGTQLQLTILPVYATVTVKNIVDLLQRPHIPQFKLNAKGIKHAASLYRILDANTANESFMPRTVIVADKCDAKLNIGFTNNSFYIEITTAYGGRPISLSEIQTQCDKVGINFGAINHSISALLSICDNALPGKTYKTQINGPSRLAPVESKQQVEVISHEFIAAVSKANITEPLPSQDSYLHPITPEAPHQQPNDSSPVEEGENENVCAPADTTAFKKVDKAVSPIQNDTLIETTMSYSTVEVDDDENVCLPTDSAINLQVDKSVPPIQTDVLIETEKFYSTAVQDDISPDHTAIDTETTANIPAENEQESEEATQNKTLISGDRVKHTNGTEGLSNTGINLCQHLLTACKSIPNELAVSVQKKTMAGLTYQELTFNELHHQSDDIAFALTQYGLKAGDKAVLMVTPSIAFFNLTFALFKAGIVPILVDPGMGVKNLKDCFEKAKPDAFIGIPKAHIARVLFAWGKGSIKHLISVNGPDISGSTALSSLLKRFPRKLPYMMQELEPQQLAAILFTSGSTGSPKGVIYTHAMFEAQIAALKHDYHIQSGEADLATFPLFSLFGPALGMASIVPDMDASQPIKVNPKYVFAAIEKYQCTNLFANPALIEVLGAAGKKQNLTLPSLKRVISAGAPATLPSIQRFSEMLEYGVEIINSYGATESLPTTKIGSDALLRTASITEQGGGICVGYPLDNVEVNIIDINENVIDNWSNTLRLPAFKVGEIVVKGPHVSPAYYQLDSATSLAKINDGDQVRHRMGDLGYLDDQGKLWMCGRKAHQVASNHLDSEKAYYSIPCERIFNTHPSVKRSALIGLLVNNKKTPAICVEIEVGSKYTKKALFKELTDLAKEHALTQGITHFYIHKGFPMDIRHNAKIFREKLATWAQEKI